MKKIILSAMMIIMAYSPLLAQPSEAQVKTDFMKNGVTAVEGIIINKEWYKDHYLWKASFRTILPVKPEEVEGLKGVTMIRHVVAHYENGKKTWSGLAYSEYKGINLPTPSNAELATFAQKQMQADPSKLVRSTSSKISFDSIKVIEPETEWINPKRLEYKALLYYKDKVNYTDIAVIESPVLVSLERTSLKDPFQFRSAYQYFEKNKELSRYKEGSSPAGNQTTTNPTISNSSSSNPGAWKKGDKVMVEENGKWYPATVLDTRTNEWFIHYDGYDAKYDLWVGVARIKNK